MLEEAGALEALVAFDALSTVRVAHDQLWLTQKSPDVHTMGQIVCLVSAQFSQNSGFCEFKFLGTDRTSLRKMPLKPHEWPFKLQKWAFGELQDSELKGLGPLRLEA